MPPNNLYQNRQGEPASLPPISTAAGQPQAAAPALAPAQQPVQTVDITGRVVAEAERLAAQYANDPYRLSGELSQLKAAYHAEKYHLNVNGQSEQ